MINSNQLAANLQKLQTSLPGKPAVYTPDFPKTIAEGLTKYANRKTVNLFGINVYNYNTHEWPVPLFVDNYNIKVGFKNNIYYRIKKWQTNKSFRRLQPEKKLKKVTLWNARVRAWNWIGIPLQRNTDCQDNVDDCVIEMFNANKRVIETKFLSHPYLLGKEKIIQEIFSSYRRKNWGSSICTFFPLLDSVARQVLRTDNLTKDMQEICKLFSKNGIGGGETDVLMAHTNAVMVGEKVRQGEISPKAGKALTEKGDSYTLNIIGPALSSFLQFANRYYGYYKAETDEGDPLNRHAIVHGAYSHFSTKANAVRLFTFLYLILELDPILSILLKEGVP